jgi:cytochrome c biogenesis protein CcmG, thiol:disulfide interchange protein DsbE
MKRAIIWVPLFVFALFAGLFIHGLNKPEGRIIASHMIGKPMPAFDLPPASSSQPGLKLDDLKDGKPRLVNIFASWCVPCAAEAPQLMALKQAGIAIEGVAIRDARADVDAFLARNGNPYDRIGLDARSSVQFALGSSGVPETFLVDGKGIIRYQHVGDIRADDVPDLIARVQDAQ